MRKGVRVRGSRRCVRRRALSECRAQAGPGKNVAPLACVVGDALHIPLASQSVDVVMTRSVLIYLADKQAGVRELYRVLRPKGRASIFEPIHEVSEQVRDRVRASGFFYDELQPGEIRTHYDAHAKDWWGTLVRVGRARADRMVGRGPRAAEEGGEPDQARGWRSSFDPPDVAQFTFRRDQSRA